MTAPGSPSLSVVIFSREMPESLEAAVDSALSAGGDPPAEVWLADASEGTRGLEIAGERPWLRHLRRPRASMPSLKREALLAATGELVAFLDAVDAAEPGWGDELRAAFDGDPLVVAAGGAVLLDDTSGSANRAVYLFEYGAFQPPFAGGETGADLPGNNVAYRRGRLLSDASNELARDGFYKPFCHEALRRRGGRLVLRPQIRVKHLTRHRLLPAARRRFHYGRYFGALRRRRAEPARRLLYVLGAPVVPLLLLARHLSRAHRHPGNRGLLRGAAGALAVICLAWGLGEWLGTWLGPGGSGRELY